MQKLYQVIENLANAIPLETVFRDHNLSGNYKGTRECHVEPDWLLIYEISNEVLILIVHRVGTHADLF